MYGERGDAARTILVTSAYPGEGKSTVVANLGRSLAQSGQSTLLIDADLRRPVLHTFFGIDNSQWTERHPSRCRAAGSSRVGEHVSSPPASRD
jgi:Mrp family chromosome partitioning ATPase